MAITYPRILYLTTLPSPSPQCAILAALRQRGAHITILSWLDPSLHSPTALSEYDLITVIGISTYHWHAQPFATFLSNILLPAATQLFTRTLRVANPAPLIQWNYDKRYLLDLAAAGFTIPHTQLLESTHPHTPDQSARIRAILATWPTPHTSIVVKPSISASSKDTHLILDREHLTSSDETFLSSLIPSIPLLLQTYEPSISRGEYSLIFLCGIYSHTILKTPKCGEFRCQARFGGGVQVLSPQKTPPQAMRVAERVVRLLEGRFCVGDERLPYLRVDGVVNGEGMFVLMEIEGIEPELWLGEPEALEGRERLMRGLMEGFEKGKGECGGCGAGKGMVEVQRGSVFEKVVC